MRHLRLGLAQINPTMGDLDANKEKIIEYIRKAKDLHLQMVVFPELVTCGYPPKDLLLRPRFLKKNWEMIQSIVSETSGIAVVLGFPMPAEDIYNAAAIIHDGKLLGIQYKIYLPNYGVFDENRYFQAGKESLIFELDTVTFGVNICEDVWYIGGPTRYQALSGAELIINISASP